LSLTACEEEEEEEEEAEEGEEGEEETEEETEETEEEELRAVVTGWLELDRPALPLRSCGRWGERSSGRSWLRGIAPKTLSRLQCTKIPIAYCEYSTVL
jgi:hypothetical protein